MGGSTNGNFGRTLGNEDFLDSVSQALALASLVPGLDTVTNLAAFPVDLARGDYLSAGLDLLGVIPVAGEFADTARLAMLAGTIKNTDKAADAIKAARKASNFSDLPKTIHMGKQGKHILGHNNYQKGKSILNISTDSAQDLIKKYSGTGQKMGKSREKIDFGTIIGKYVHPQTGKTYDTTIGTIHYSKNGTHLVPEKPIDFKD